MTGGVAASPSPDVTDRVVNDKVIGDGSAPTENPVENSSLAGLSKDSTELAATEIEKPPEWVEWRENSDSLEPTDVNLNSAESSTAAADSTESSDATSNSNELPDAATNVDSQHSVTESSEQTDATKVPVAPPSTDINEPSSVDDTTPALPNDEFKVELESRDDDSSANKTDDSSADKTDNSPSSTGQPTDVEKSNVGGLPETGNTDTSTAACQPLEGDGTSSSSSNIDEPAETEVVTSGAAELEVEK